MYIAVSQGAVEAVPAYPASYGYAVPAHCNPAADWVITVVVHVKVLRLPLRFVFIDAEGCYYIKKKVLYTSFEFPFSLHVCVE